MESKLEVKTLGLDIGHGGVDEKLSPLGGIGMKVAVLSSSDATIYFPPRETSPKLATKTVSALSMLLSGSASVSAQNSPSITATTRSKSISPYSIPSSATSSATASVVGYNDRQYTRGANSRTSTLNDLKEGREDDEDSVEMREPLTTTRPRTSKGTTMNIPTIAESYGDQFGSFGASYVSRDMEMGSSEDDSDDDSGFGESLEYVDDNEFERGRIELERNRQRLDTPSSTTAGYGRSDKMELSPKRNRKQVMSDEDESFSQDSLFDDIEIAEVDADSEAKFFGALDNSSCSDVEPLRMNELTSGRERSKGLGLGQDDSDMGGLSSSQCSDFSDFGSVLPNDAVAFSIEDLNSLPSSSIPHYGEFKTRSEDGPQAKLYANRHGSGMDGTSSISMNKSGSSK